MKFIIITASFISCISSLKCWNGYKGPEVNVGSYNFTDVAPGNLCYSIKQKGAETYVYQTFSINELNLIKEGAEWVKDCSTDFCNAPADAKIPVTKVETTPSKGPLKCWTSDKDKSPFKNEMAVPGYFCGRFILIGQSEASYAHIDPESNNIYSKLTNGVYMFDEYYTCNTDYCNDPSLDYKALQTPVWVGPRGSGSGNGSGNGSGGSVRVKKSSAPLLSISMLALALPLLSLLF